MLTTVDMEEGLFILDETTYAVAVLDVGSMRRPPRSSASW